MNKILITEPEPRCPKCNSYHGFNIKPVKKLTGDWKRMCMDCGYKGNLDTFKYD
jgi:hypothetical protein